ncbi:MAG: MerR family transcriptional regulator [Bdellovibrionaceae bacterium]|nr:MerR family transcriptional regulator [Pseudobdellovibrionaceae bacterium]
MLSIGQFADMAQVSARTVRYYESIGLLPASTRGENNYRFYSQNLLERMKRIRDLQGLGFSLEDIKIIISFSDSDLKTRLNERLLEIEQEIDNLEERRERVQNLLSVSNKIDTGETLTETERNLYMDSIKEQVMSGLRSRYNGVTDSALAYLKRDTWLDVHPQVGEFIEAVKKCMEFAKAKNLTLGTARGSSPASMSFFGLGFSEVDPLKYEMIPERLSTQAPFFHIDVEYERGQEFVDFCREMNKSLTYGEIQAFKMPLIDVVQNTHKAIGQVINYDNIEDDSDTVLNPFKNLDLEKIFQFDFSEDALVMNYERFLPEYLGLAKITEHFKGQKVFSFRDIINITALWRPHSQENVDRINLYRQAKAKPFSYGFLSEKIEAWLKPNYGTVIYHEDIIKIVSEYTGWDFARSNSLRRVCMNKNKIVQRDQDANWLEFQKIAPKPVVDLVAEESKWAFCFPHAIAFAKFTKQTAVLKTLHKNAYFTEIVNFEQKHGFKWDDIGIRIKGVSLHQG